MAFDNPFSILIVIVVLALVLYFALFSGRRNKSGPKKPSSGFRTLGYILIVLGVLVFFFDPLFFFPLIIVGMLLVWFDRAPRKDLEQQRTDAQQETPSTPRKKVWPSRQTRKLIVIIAAVFFVLYVGIISYETSYQSYLDSFSGNSQNLHYPYTGVAITQGRVISAMPSSIVGFLGIGQTPVEELNIFVPATNANLSAFLVNCNSYHVGDTINVEIEAYNVSQQVTFPTNFPSNVSTSMSSSAVLNPTLDQSTTVVYDQIGRDYSVVNVTSPCQA